MSSQAHQQWQIRTDVFDQMIRARAQGTVYDSKVWLLTSGKILLLAQWIQVNHVRNTLNQMGTLMEWRYYHLFPTRMAEVACIGSQSEFDKIFHRSFSNFVAPPTSPTLYEVPSESISLKKYASSTRSIFTTASNEDGSNDSVCSSKDRKGFLNPLYEPSSEELREEIKRIVLRNPLHDHEVSLSKNDDSGICNHTFNLTQSDDCGKEYSLSSDDKNADSTASDDLNDDANAGSTASDDLNDDSNAGSTASGADLSCPGCLNSDDSSPAGSLCESDELTSSYNYLVFTLNNQIGPRRIKYTMTVNVEVTDLSSPDDVLPSPAENPHPHSHNIQGVEHPPSIPKPQEFSAAEIPQSPPSPLISSPSDEYDPSTFKSQTLPTAEIPQSPPNPLISSPSIEYDPSTFWDPIYRRLKEILALPTTFNLIRSFKEAHQDIFEMLINERDQDTMLPDFAEQFIATNKDKPECSIHVSLFRWLLGSEPFYLHKQLRHQLLTEDSYSQIFRVVKADCVKSINLKTYENVDVYLYTHPDYPRLWLRTYIHPGVDMLFVTKELCDVFMKAKVNAFVEMYTPPM